MSELQAIRLTDARPAAGFRPRFRSTGAAAPAAPPAVEADEDLFALGYREGFAQAEQDYAGERAQLAALVAGCAALQPAPSEELALLIAETVDRLVRLTAGEAAVDPDLLLARARRAASLIADADQAATLHLHPDDLALLAPSILPLAAFADPGLPRGSLRIADSTGWVEDGVATHLEALREQLGLEGAAQ